MHTECLSDILESNLQYLDAMVPEGRDVLVAFPNAAVADRPQNTALLPERTLAPARVCVSLQEQS